MKKSTQKKLIQTLTLGSVLLGLTSGTAEARPCAVNVDAVINSGYIEKADAVVLEAVLKSNQAVLAKTGEKSDFTVKINSRNKRIFIGGHLIRILSIDELVLYRGQGTMAMDNQTFESCPIGSFGEICASILTSEQHLKRMSHSLKKLTLKLECR